MSSAAKAGIGIAGLVAAVVLFIVLSGGDDSGSTAPESTTITEASGSGGDRTGGGAEAGVPTIVVRDGEPVGGVEELSFTKGEEIRFKVESDVDEEVHFHGYDVAKEVRAGGSVSFDVPATIEGVFEVELENSVVQIAEITVNP